MTEPALGIDIARLKFNACLIRHGGKLKHEAFPNSETGFEQLAQWLPVQGVERAHAYATLAHESSAIRAPVE